ncbi:MAG: glycyl-radical enzyme activating protein [Clostridiales bacterium]|nr:glycyl-radical enzyme activating protein [Clostridiales bacterium]
MESAVIFNIQHFSIHDGPGVRTTVFMKGCNLRCWWCHNPESWEHAPTLCFHPTACIDCNACGEACPQAENGKAARFTHRCTQCGKCTEACYAGALSLMGRKITLAELMEELLKDQSIYLRSQGGVTFSGGEPLLQAPFLLKALLLLQARGIHTAIESALHAPWEVLSLLLPHLNLIMADIKCMDPIRHQAHTGKRNEQILSNIQRLAEKGFPLVLRTPIIPGVNDDAESIRAIGTFIAGLNPKIPLELLPFNPLCTEKYASMNQSYPGARLTPPSKEKMDALLKEARQLGIEASHQ